MRSKTFFSRLTLLSLILCLCAEPSALLAQAAPASKAPTAKASAHSLASTQGEWAAPVNFCTYPCLVGSDAAVLNNGSVLFYYYPASGWLQSQAMVLNPVTGVITNVLLPFDDDIFCSGLSIMENGNVLVTGGNVQGVTCSHDASGCGTTNTFEFNPATYQWTQQTDMINARWYPSTIELPNGLMLEISGTNSTGAWVQTQMETFNYQTNSWTALPASANLPSEDAQVYPRLTLLPTGNVFLSSPAAQSYQFNPTTNQWSYVATVNFGYRYFAPHVLLPGGEKILVSGGSPSKLNGGSTATATAEIIDMSQAKPAWSYINSMNYARYNQNLVLLADGTVLAVGGGGGGGRYANPVYSSEIYNPTTGTWTLMASQQIQRTYHSTAVLIPDGRVVSAGSDNGAPEQVSYEIYSPPYLFNGPRPVISAAPTSLNYNQKFTITTAEASSIASVALVRPGATTHADNMDQRYVNLKFTPGDGTLTATAPANANLAPPGYYMLVIVNHNGIPSVMPFLQLSSTKSK
ncbi:MAG: galactose oxidase-like domain-containing protein [Candidatus Sulfotelmatobacter sp.]